MKQPQGQAWLLLTLTRPRGHYHLLDFPGNFNSLSSATGNLRARSPALRVTAALRCAVCSACPCFMHPDIFYMMDLCVSPANV